MLNIKFDFRRAETGERVIELRPNQLVHALRSFLNGRDEFVCLPNGSVVLKMGRL